MDLDDLEEINNINAKREFYWIYKEYDIMWSLAKTNKQKLSCCSIALVRLNLFQDRYGYYNKINKTIMKLETEYYSLKKVVNNDCVSL